MFEDFPQMDHHCSYNQSLGPCEKSIAELFSHVISQQEEFFNAYLNGIVGKF